MGVKDLWSVLDPVAVNKQLTHLTGKKVAIDLSCWVLEAKECQGSKKTKNPHLRTLFFRVSRLLKNGVIPVFITEGKMPALKESTLKKRDLSRHPEKQKSDFKGDLTRSTFDKVLKECQEMLTCLGVPCLKSAGEAEAFCAFLDSNDVVSGCVTEDSDAFLYGAKTVFRGFTIKEGQNIKEYKMDDIQEQLKLDRRKLVAMALLLGCDYVDGVPGIGKETALKFFTELKDADIIERFRNWKNLSQSELFPFYDASLDRKITHCEICGHPGTYIKHSKTACEKCDSRIPCYPKKSEDLCDCHWHQCERKRYELKIYKITKERIDFPKQEVIDEYLNYTDEIPTDCLEWKQPDLISFQDKAENWIGWTVQKSFGYMLPIITTWQITRLCLNATQDASDFTYRPLKILKKKVKKKQNYFEVHWIQNGDDESTSNTLTTDELQKNFEKAYPNITNDFLTANAKIKDNKKKKVKKGKKNSDHEPKNNKIKDYFPVCKNNASSEDKNVTTENIQLNRKRHADDDSSVPSCKKGHMSM